MKKIGVLLTVLLFLVGYQVLALRPDDEGCGPRDPHSYHNGITKCYNLETQACGTGCSGH